MADYWTTPKINWNTSDGIGYADLNRIEANISANRDANFRKVQGFGYATDNSVGGQDGVVTIFPGSCYSDNDIPIKMGPSNFDKNLTAWAQGNGVTFGGMAAAVTVAANTWYYAFVIMNPTDGSTEIMFDDNPSGTNITSGTYTEKRFINSFKTRAAGGDGSFDLVEMYSTGDRVFINPNSMYTNRTITYTNTAPNNNVYNLITLTSGGEGFALPARAVKADLNIQAVDATFGLISDYFNIFTVPTNLFPVIPGIPHAEFYEIQILNTGSSDLAVMITAARQINLAMYDASVDTGTVDMAIRGFHDERLL